MEDFLRELKIQLDQMNRIKELTKEKEEVLSGTEVDKLGQYIHDNINFENNDNIMKMCEESVRRIRSTEEWLKEIEFNRNKLDIETIQMIMARAVDLCPEDTGTLKRSAFIRIFEDRAIIGFNCVYGYYVHENLNTRHSKGQAKFLERAIQEFLPNTTVAVHLYERSMLYAVIYDNGKVELY